MGDRSLSIRVKVNLPTAGELEGKIQRSLSGLKDINVHANARVNVKVAKGGLAAAKRAIREGLKGSKLNARVGVKVEGLAGIEKLSGQLKELRKIAEKPIKLNVDTGGGNFEKEIKDAAKSGNRVGYGESAVARNKLALQQQRQYLKDIAGLRKQEEALLTRQIKAGAGTDAFVEYEKQAQRANAARKKVEDEFRRSYQRSAGIIPGDAGYAKQLAEVNREAAEYIKVANSKGGSNLGGGAARAQAQVSASLNAQKAAYKEATAAAKEYYKVVNQRIKAEKGSNEAALLSSREKALAREKMAAEGSLYGSYRRRYAAEESGRNLSYRIREARAIAPSRRAVSGYRNRLSNGGITANMDIFSLLQGGAFAAAGIVSQLNDVDKAITRVTKVVPDSQRAVNQWKKNIYKDASEVGKSAPEFANAVEQWATAGYNLKQANNLAKKSVMGSFVGNVPVEDMVKYMSVPLNSFKKQKLKADDIINSMNQVSNKHAVEMEDLGQAYSKASSVVAATGTSFHQLTGMITGAQEATRAGGDVIGRSIKAISLNFSKMSSGVTASDRSRAQFFHGLGVDLKDSNGKMKSTYEIMDQLSSKWKGLSRQQKQDAALYAAGKEHSAQFTGMLDNWGTVRKATAESEEQAGLGREGSAYIEFGKQKQSIEYQLAALKNTWTSFLNGFTGGRQGIGQMLSMLTGLAGIADKIASNELFSSTARWGVLAAGAMLGRRAIGKAATSFFDLVTAQKGVAKEGKEVSGFFDKFTGLSQKNSDMAKAKNKFADAWSDLTGRPRKNKSEIPSEKERTTATSIDYLRSRGGGSLSGATAAAEKHTKAIQKLAKANEEASTSLATVGSEAGRAGEKLNKKMGDPLPKTTSKLAKFGNVAKAGMGLLAGGLGYVGLALDAVTLASMGMEALGIHPIQAMERAMHPARTAAEDFNKSFAKIAASVDQTNDAINSNGIVTGRLSSDLKSVSSMRDAVKGLGADTRVSGDQFSDLKKAYNDVAKSNGLELRIGDNNSAGNLQQKINALQQSLKQVKKDDIQSLGEQAEKQIGNIDRALSTSNWQKVLESDSTFQKQLQDANKGLDSRSGNKAARAQRQLNEDKLAENYRVGENNARIWNSAEGRKVSAAVARAQQGLRQAITGMGDAYANGTITSKDMMSMSDSGRSLLGLGVLKNLRDLKGTDSKSKEVQKANSDLSAVFKNLGASAKQVAQLQKDAFKGNNANLLKDLSAKGIGINKQAIAALAGIGAQYQQQHGKGFLRAAESDQRDLERYTRQNKSKHENADALINPNTGFIDYNKIAKFNSGAVTSRVGKGILQSMGAQYQSKGAMKGTLSVGQLLRLTSGLSGDPTRILNDIAKGRASVAETASVINNAHRRVDANGNFVKGTGATGAQIEQGIVQSRGANGRRQSARQFHSGIQEALSNGQITAAQADAADKRFDYNHDSRGNAKTTAGFKDMVQKGQKLSEQAFKDMTKGLSNAERKSALAWARKNGNLTKGQAKDLNRYTKEREKGARSKTEKNTDSGDPDERRTSRRPTRRTTKSREPLLREAVADIKSPIGSLLTKGLGGLGSLVRGLKLPNLGSLFKGIKLPNIGGLFKGLKIPNMGNMFKGFKMPNFSNMFKGFKMPKIQNPFKNFKFPKMPSGLSKLFSGKGGDPFRNIKTSLGNLFKGGKGNKVKISADTNSLKRSIANATKGGGKGNKVKISADTGSLKKSISSAAKGSKAKVKVSADTGKLKSSISNAVKGVKAKVKASADTGKIKSSISSAVKGVKAKVKVSAETGALKSSITSAVRSVKAKVSVSVSNSGALSKLKSTLSSLSNKNVTVTVNVNGTGKAKQLKSAIDGINAKSVAVTAVVTGTGKVRALSSAIDSVHDKHVSVTASVSGLGEVQSLGAAINALHDKTVNISVNKSESVTTSSKSKSVAVAPIVANGNPLTSMSVVAGNPALATAVDTSAANMGVDANSQMNGQSVTDYSDSTQDVNEDYWRYMGNELYTGLPLDEQVQKLEDAITTADDDMDKLISVSKQRIDLDNKQIAYQKTMQAAYQQQVSDMINKLHAYGFQNNGNQITNLGHAKDIHGDNATKVDDLLSKYQTAYQNYSEATKKISELQTDIWQQGKNQNDYRNTKEQKMVEDLQRHLDLLTTALKNHTDILEREASSLGDKDYKMKLKNGSDQIYARTEDTNKLIDQFNSMSVANFSTKENDNAKNLADSLASLKDTIMENVDAIDSMKNEMRDLQLNAIVDNLGRFADNLNDSIDRMKTNISSLQEGLLSGTTYSDLYSSDLSTVNLSQKTAYEQSVMDKISLEQQLDSALDKFAKKNIERTEQVGNDQLQIHKEVIAKMLDMDRQYARGYIDERGAGYTVQYESNLNSSEVELPQFTHNKGYLETSQKYQKAMNELKAKYNDEMDRANTAEQREALNQQMVYIQLGLQQEIYQELINTNKKAITDLKEMAKDPGLSTEQQHTIADQIAQYEKDIIDAQNNIRDAVKGRFDYEKQLLDKQIDDYKRVSDYIGTMVTIADALHLDGDTQATVIGEQFKSAYREYSNYLTVLKDLHREMSQYEKGSYEYNQLSAMVNEYEANLNSMVTALLDISKNQFNQTLTAIQTSFEKNVNKGMTADQAKFDQGVWFNPMQKELKLEEMRLKIIELEDKTVEKRLAALDAQKQMSKAEADYVDKQLDLALAEQRLNNTINKKDVRYLQKDENGKFNWTYMANQDSVDAARMDVNKARQSIEDAKVADRNDYIRQVEETIGGIKDGTVNEEEARKRLTQLNDSYKFILKDIEGFDVSKVEDILQAYDDYAAKNSKIVADYGKSNVAQSANGYREIVKGFGDQFKMVAKDLGDIFGKQLRDAIKLPGGLANVYGTDGKNQSVTIQRMNVDLPNVHDVDEFAKALETLPQIARQHATTK